MSTTTINSQVSAIDASVVTACNIFSSLGLNQDGFAHTLDAPFHVDNVEVTVRIRYVEEMMEWNELRVIEKITVSSKHMKLEVPYLLALGDRIIELVDSEKLIVS